MCSVYLWKHTAQIDDIWIYEVIADIWASVSAMTDLSLTKEVKYLYKNSNMFFSVILMWLKVKVKDYPG